MNGIFAINCKCERQGDITGNVHNVYIYIYSKWLVESSFNVVNQSLIGHECSDGISWCAGTGGGGGKVI